MEIWLSSGSTTVQPNGNNEIVAVLGEILFLLDIFFPPGKQEVATYEPTLHRSFFVKFMSNPNVCF